MERMPRISDFCTCVCVFGCKLSLVRLCVSDLGITPVDDITIGISFAAFCFHIAHNYVIRQSLVLVLFVGYCFGEIMCVWNSYVYQKGVLCFLIHKSYVQSIRRYFVRKYAAIPVQLEIFTLQYIGCCALIIWTFLFNKFSCFCQFLMDKFG